MSVSRDVGYPPAPTTRPFLACVLPLMWRLRYPWGSFCFSWGGMHPTATAVLGCVRDCDRSTSKLYLRSAVPSRASWCPGTSWRWCLRRRRRGSTAAGSSMGTAARLRPRQETEKLLPCVDLPINRYHMPIVEKHVPVYVKLYSGLLDLLIIIFLCSNIA